MQAVKEKLSDMVTMRKVKADARAEEKAEKEMAKTRVEVAKEIRKAKEAEAARDLHFARAEEKVNQEIEKVESHLAHEEEPHLTREPKITRDPVLGGTAEPDYSHTTSTGNPNNMLL